MRHVCLQFNQPREIKDIRDFLFLARRKDAKEVKIWRARPSQGSITKFKIRCSRYVYTLRVGESEKANRLKASLPPGLKKISIPADKQ